MQTVQIRLTGELVKRAQSLVDNGLYSNRSEVVRDALRRLVVSGMDGIKNDRKFVALFSSDLHGNLEQYHKLFKTALEDRVDAVIVGGDITPKDPERRTPAGQKKFLIKDLFPLISDFNKQNKLREHDCKVYIIMGNDDFKSNRSFMKMHQKPVGFNFIDNKCLKLHEDFKILGYSYVPLTPFKYKDWERLDLNYSSEKNTRGNFEDSGFKSVGKKLVRYKINLSDRKKTIENDLKRLLNKEKNGKVVLISHAPPKNTNLDKIYTDEHVGSYALRKVIEENHPYLVLSGHIHETVNKSGTFKDRIGSTICMTSGNNHVNKNLAVLKFNLYDLNNAVRLVI